MEDRLPDAAPTEPDTAQPELRRAEPTRLVPPRVRPAGAAAARPGSGSRPQIDGRPRPEPRARPDARPLRIAYGMGGIAAASAIATAMLGSGGGGSAQGTSQVVTLPADTSPPVRHVVQYVQLKPGQTAPPQSVVQQAPAPKPRVVVVTTRQSGAKP